MNLVSRAILSSLVFAVGGPALHTGSEFDIKRKAVVGEKVTWDIYTSLSDNGARQPETHGVVTQEITQVFGDGSYKVRITDGEAALEDDSSTDGTLVLSPTGEVKSVDAGIDTTLIYRQLELLQVVMAMKPVKVGSEWESTTKGNAKLKTVDVFRRYKVLARKTMLGRDCLKISLDHQEQHGGNGTYKGTCWIDVTNGVIVKLDALAAGMQVDGHTLDIGYRMELKSDKTP